MFGKPAAPESTGPVTIERLRKDDGRALILYSVASDANAKSDAAASAQLDPNPGPGSSPGPSPGERLS